MWVFYELKKITIIKGKRKGHVSFNPSLILIKPRTVNLFLFIFLFIFFTHLLHPSSLNNTFSLSFFHLHYTNTNKVTTTIEAQTKTRFNSNTQNQT